MRTTSAHPRATSDTAPDAALVERARAGEPAAWAEIYDGCHLPVYRYVQARIFDAAAAEDVTSEVFLAAVRGIGGYRDRGKPLLAWLFGIAAHAVRDHQRRHARRRRLWERLVPASETAPRPDALATPSMEAEVEQRLDLARALERLTPAQREVIILRYFVDLSTAEIAEVLGKDASAVYSLHARALVLLREVFSEESSPARDEFPRYGAISRVEA